MALLYCAPGGRTFLGVKVSDPIGRGNDASRGKMVQNRFQHGSQDYGSACRSRSGRPKEGTKPRAILMTPEEF